MPYHNKNHRARIGALTIISMAVLAGCTGKADKAVSDLPTPQSMPTQAAVQDFPMKIGDPYQVDGKTYVPEDTANYDAVGYTSWYGQELAGRSTANGEIFNPRGISGAHKTLPMPSYVEVTALDTGRTILVRINDRGPFTGNRLIDLSQGSAEALGISASGVAPVRVRKVNPTEEERIVLRSGGMAVERIETPDTLLGVLRRKLAEESGRPVPPPKMTGPPVSAPPVRTATAAPPVTATRPAPPPPAQQTPVRSGNDRFIVEERGTQRKPTAVPSARVPIAETEVQRAQPAYVVQIGAFSDRARADAMARKAGAKVSSGGGVFRVRLGPFSNPVDADRAAANARAKGYGGARVLRGD